MTATVEIHAREPREPGLLVNATITTPEGTRSGPYLLEVPVDADDATVRAAVAALYGTTAA